MSKAKNEPYVDPILFEKDAFGSKKNYQKWASEMDSDIQQFLGKRKPVAKTGRVTLKGTPKTVVRGKVVRKKKK